MELRKDPITRSWVVAGYSEADGIPQHPCPLCPDSPVATQQLLVLPPQEPWRVRVFPHFQPLYQIEAEPSRAAEGIYDRMAATGAHEIIVETRDHQRSLADMSDSEIEMVLEAYAQRIIDLKHDSRFKYVTIFKNRGEQAGEEWTHAHSQLTATTFVPRRVLYELRSARLWYRERERCVFCDIMRQEIRQAKRVVDNVGDYYAFAPYASRVPFETWLMPRTHNHQFEVPLPGENRRQLASLLRRTLHRITRVTTTYHMVLHTAPNTLQSKGELSEYWQTIAGDYHWHIEILPIVQQRNKSYSIKETYSNGMLPEQAAERLRQIDPEK